MSSTPLALRITVRETGLADLLNKLSSKDKKSLYKEFDKVMRKNAKLIQTKTRKGLDTGKYGPRSRNRSLRSAIIGEAYRLRGVPAMRVGVFRDARERKKAFTLEFGTQGLNPDSPVKTIVPKKAKFLAWPNPRNPKVSTRGGRQKYTSPRDYGPKTRAIMYRRDPENADGNEIVGGIYDESDLRKRKSNSLREMKALFFLMNELDIPASYFLSTPFYEEIPRIREELREIIYNYLSR